MASKKNEKLKLEIAKELGLLEKVQKEGWKSLSAKETGRIGGLMAKRKNWDKGSECTAILPMFMIFLQKT
ncbi:alpha/beta-type small acid-soluble spore protein [Thermoclostridium stercorarium]|uniref:small, acid-soluble spore protein, alpha/beta type n=1 Tax=Thermoclostridium stercorarium TaxID=1510 RepID=UPI0022498297|nr:small, acid-soluble spore protein, alpha/beta type [Thermoclostridium stercorarium]UZQ85977.1 alpha/beta-type small acid-soluble spore protein [Thermoclostridium stercorarium]